MTGSPQLDFESALGLMALPALAAAHSSAPSLPSPLIGEADVLRLQADGWAFADGGLKLGNCWACWAKRGDEWKPCFLADPDKYPEAWPGEPNTKVSSGD